MPSRSSSSNTHSSGASYCCTVGASPRQASMFSCACTAAVLLLTAGRACRSSGACGCQSANVAVVQRSCAARGMGARKSWPSCLTLTKAYGMMVYRWYVKFYMTHEVVSPRPQQCGTTQKYVPRREPGHRKSNYAAWLTPHYIFYPSTQHPSSAAVAACDLLVLG